MWIQARVLQREHLFNQLWKHWWADAGLRKGSVPKSWAGFSNRLRWSESFFTVFPLLQLWRQAGTGGVAGKPELGIGYVSWQNNPWECATPWT